MKKFIIALVAAFVLCVPALAVDGDVYFAAAPYDVTLSGSSYYNFTSSDNVYFFWRIDGNGRYALIPISESNTATYTQVISSTTTVQFTTSQSFGDYYVTPIASRPAAMNSSLFANIGYSPITAIFDQNATDADIQAAFAQYLASSPDEPVGLTSVLVPRGNVLYFKAASDYVFGFEAEFSKYSALLGGGDIYGPWGDTYQRISIETTLPVAGITFPRPNSTAISWEKGAPYNVLGQSKRGLYRTSVEADGTYIAFYNPAYQSVTGSDGDGSAEVGCNVWVTGDFDFIRIYPLQQLLDSSSSPDGYENYLNGTPDGDTVIWTDPDDNVSAPVSGGDNQEDEPISSVSLIESIKRILRNILSEIESIFTFGFSAIRDLVDLMDEFVATFDDLYEWLPDECYTLLIACVSVAIVIGVFKVFL